MPKKDPLLSLMLTAAPFLASCQERESSAETANRTRWPASFERC